MSQRSCTVCHQIFKMVIGWIITVKIPNEFICSVENMRIMIKNALQMNVIGRKEGYFSLAI